MFLLHDQRGDAERARKSVYHPPLSHGLFRRCRLSLSWQDRGRRGNYDRGRQAHERAWRWELRVHVRHVYTYTPESCGRVSPTRKTAALTEYNRRWVRRYLNVLHTVTRCAAVALSDPATSSLSPLLPVRPPSRFRRRPLVGRPHQRALS